jgi:hypothetical protein
MLIPGTNGGKWASQANNIINIFLNEALRKQMMV